MWECTYTKELPSFRVSGRREVKTGKFEGYESFGFFFWMGDG